MINLLDMSEDQIINVAAQLMQNEKFKPLGNVADHKASFFFLISRDLYWLPIDTTHVTCADILSHF